MEATVSSAPVDRSIHVKSSQLRSNWGVKKFCEDRMIDQFLAVIALRDVRVAPMNGSRGFVTEFHASANSNQAMRSMFTPWSKWASLYCHWSVSWHQGLLYPYLAIIG